ncbi:heterokaryon incompatibility protein-domain-containing protein [Nemania sp. NC0429]|nr:heterokaryon incompatibility protein-domain-containing protein [Nemania sp. NC0429]
MFEFDYDKLYQFSKSIKYKYDDIESIQGVDHIRILSLTASESFTDPINVSLSTVSLVNPPTYEALSYCWGDASDLGLIFCDDKPFPVTKNLESALRHLRQSQGDRVLWIDAICINQENLAERAYQVNLMRRIYQIACKVLIWLGDDSEDSKLVLPLCERTVAIWWDLLSEDSFTFGDVDPSRPDIMEIMKEKLKEAKRRKSTIKSRPDQSLGSTSIENCDGRVEESAVLGETIQEEEEAVQDITREELAACMRLVSRPWFSRCWVVQEAALAREAIVLCGTSSLDWDFFYWGFRLIVLLRRGTTGEPERVSTSNLDLIRGLRQKKLGMNRDGQEEHIDLLQLLWDVRQLDATDPRDKVYSVVGLIDPAEARTEGLTSNYTISVEESYKRVTLAIMSYTRNLDVLITDYNPGSKLIMPSWIADWNSMRSPSPSSILRSGERGDSRYKQFQASGSSRWDPEGKVHGDALKLSGYMFDTIIALEDIRTTAEFDYIGMDDINSISTYIGYFKRFLCGVGEHHDRLVMWEKLAFSRRYSTYPTGEDPETAFAITLCAGKIERSEEALAGYRHLYKMLRAPRAVNFLRYFGPNSQIYKTIVAAMGLITIFCHGVPRGYLDASKKTLYRRLARTRKGYLVVAPSHSALGDQISLFQGGNVPFVVRPMHSESEYRLIGPSYVHGIMYGEAWDDSVAQDVMIV